MATLMNRYQQHLGILQRRRTWRGKEPKSNKSNNKKPTMFNLCPTKYTLVSIQNEILT